MLRNAWIRLLQRTFSEITGVYIVSSSMHPVYQQVSWDDMKGFPNTGCGNSSFLEWYGLNVVYGGCDASVVTKVYNDVFF